MTKITFEEFQKLELRIGKVIKVDKVTGSEKLLQLEVDFGDEKRQILAGISQYYSPEEIEEKSFTFVTNLEPRKLMGLESQGMMLCADVDGRPVCLTPVSDVPAGSKVR